MADQPMSDEDRAKVRAMLEELPETLREAREYLEDARRRYQAGTLPAEEQAETLRFGQTLKEAGLLLQLAAELSPENPNPPHLDEGGQPIPPP
jgi:hypothetical protein